MGTWRVNLHINCANSDGKHRGRFLLFSQIFTLVVDAETRLEGKLWCKRLLRLSSPTGTEADLGSAVLQSSTARAALVQRQVASQRINN